jgi:DNA (cytosine-5)-methyltransferase 1
MTEKMTNQNNIKVIDLFAGAGGFGLGFHLAGYDVEFSLEIDDWAVDTLKHNNPSMIVTKDDIRNYNTLAEIRSVYTGSPDIIIGGPPCQGFSIAGPAQKDPKDPRNSLFQNFAKWVELLEPKMFVMENVKGLLSRHNAKGEKVIDIIQKTFVDLGYDVEVWLLNAAEYGVPQIRERILIVGNRLGIKKIGMPPKTHSLSNGKSNGHLPPAITLWDAISDLPPLESGCGKEEQPYILKTENNYQQFLHGNQKVLFNHVAMRHSKRLVERFKHINWGESSADVPEEHRAHSRNGNGEISEKVYDQNNRRLYPHKPSHTIAAAFYANFIHPFQHRNLTAREGARIQSFPDWYKFLGKKTIPSHKLLEREGRLDELHLCQYNQIGNAIPPLLAKSVAEYLEKLLCPQTLSTALTSNKNKILLPKNMQTKPVKVY